jgi:hypothetical protein
MSKNALSALTLPAALPACSTVTRDPPVPPPVSRAAPFDMRQIRHLRFEGIATIRQGVGQSFREQAAEAVVDDIEVLLHRTPSGYAAPQGDIAQQ